MPEEKIRLAENFADSAFRIYFLGAEPICDITGLVCLNDTDIGQGDCRRCNIPMIRALKELTRIMDDLARI